MYQENQQHKDNLTWKNKTWSKREQITQENNFKNTVCQRGSKGYHIGHRLVVPKSYWYDMQKFFKWNHNSTRNRESQGSEIFKNEF